MNKFIIKIILFTKNFLINKLILILYVILILFIIIITVNHQNKQQIEHFISLKKFNNPNIQKKECRKMCYVKYPDEPEKLKVCKKYCSCKKKCSREFNNKKCMKKCKQIKNQIADKNSIKYQKNKLKSEIKSIEKKIKNKKLSIKLEKKKIESKNLSNAIPQTENKSYVTYLINNYLSEDDKVYLLGINKNVKHFLKRL